MSSEERRKTEPGAGTFGGCLVGGNAEENAREKKIKRRAIGVSVLLQSAGLAALLIAPLFAKPAELTERIAVPIPPYRHGSEQRHVTRTPPARPATQICLVCPITSKPFQGPIAVHGSGKTEDLNEGISIGDRSDESPIQNIFDSRTQPSKPETPPQSNRIHVTKIDPALLIRRVEPIYPHLARQLHKSGKVELYAIIATDGRIQSLQVVDGDPFFVRSALEAVEQWRYKPTYLNGRPVEIDTFITVIYTLQ
jgi:TonB family C-terminal domain